MSHTDLPAEELLAALTLAVPDLIFIVDATGKYRAIMGGADGSRYRDPQREKRLVGAHITDVVPAALAEQCLRGIHEALRTDVVQTFTYVLNEGEIDGETGTSHRRRCWYEARVSPIPGNPDSLRSTVIVVTNITDQVSLEDRLRQLSWQDELTGAANRKAFLHRATELTELSRRHGLPLALAILDIEQLASVNDYCGYEAGDSLLPQVVAVLTRNLRISDVLTRIGDDEFALLMPCTTGLKAQQILERLNDTIRAQVFECNGHEVGICFSAGIASYSCGSSAKALSKMLQGAESALVRAKSLGRGSVVLDAGPVMH